MFLIKEDTNLPTVDPSTKVSATASDPDDCGCGCGGSCSGKRWQKLILPAAGILLLLAGIWWLNRNGK